MQTNNILSATLIDIIFDGRNKAYGAYELRRTYERRIKKSLLVTFIIAGAAIGGTVMANSLKKNNGTRYAATEMNLRELPKEKEPEKIKEPEKQKPQQQQEVKTEKLVELKIVDKEVIKEPPPTQDDLLVAKIDIEKREGPEDGGVIDKPGPENPGGVTGIVEPPKVKDEGPLTIVEIDAKFEGNWKAFLENNLNANVPVDNGAPAGRYSVVVRFVVDKEGQVSDIVTLTSHGYGMEEEAVRVLRKAKRWEPAIQNGTKVKAYRKQVIVFEVVED